MLINNKRQKKIYEILSIIKLFTHLIIGIAALNEYMRVRQYNFRLDAYYYDIIPLTVYLIIMIGSGKLWYEYIPKSGRGLVKGRSIFQITEIAIDIVAITFLTSYAPGVTQYKLLFLLVIIASILQYGFRIGVLVSILASSIIFVVDLICIPNAIVNESFQNDLIVIGIFILTAWLLGYYEKIESEHREHITQLAIVDGLTQVYNHRHFFDTLKGILEKAKQTNTQVSLLFMDIDHFKHYNDLFGHQRGDMVLKKIAATLRENVRSQDTIYRYGGEEFAIILEGVGEQEAMITAERIRQIIEKTEFEGEEFQPNGHLTVSIGVSCFPDKAGNDTDLVKSADDALYRAKFFNKNRVESYFSILQELKDDIDDKDIRLITSIKTLISVINAKDHYTYRHTERVVMFSQMLGKALNLSEEDLKTLKYGAYLHDIGKINIAEGILNKKMPLTSEEWDILKQHPANGVGIIEPVESLAKVRPLILYHHERYDGRGYPEGLKGQEIPYLARIITVVDSFDAMCSKRTYRTGLCFDEAIEELKRHSGTQFDPKITSVFINTLLTHKDRL